MSDTPARNPEPEETPSAPGEPDVTPDDEPDEDDVDEADTQPAHRLDPDGEPHRGDAGNV